MAELAFELRAEGLIDNLRDQRLKSFFACKEPRPLYADDLLHALRRKIGEQYRSSTESAVFIAWVDRLEDANIAVSFYRDSDPTRAPVDRGLYYQAVIAGRPDAAGWFYDDDYVRSAGTISGASTF